MAGATSSVWVAHRESSPSTDQSEQAPGNDSNQDTETPGCLDSSYNMAHVGYRDYITVYSAYLIGPILSMQIQPSTLGQGPPPFPSLTCNPPILFFHSASALLRPDNDTFTRFPSMRQKHRVWPIKSLIPA